MFLRTRRCPRNELAVVVINDLKLDIDLGLEEPRDSFLEQVKTHAVSHVVEVAKKTGVAEEALVETPQAGGSITNQAKEVTKLDLNKPLNCYL